MRHDPQAQRTQGTLGERIAAGDPEARAAVSAAELQRLLSGDATTVAHKVAAFDLGYRLGVQHTASAVGDDAVIHLPDTIPPRFTVVAETHDG